MLSNTTNSQETSQPHNSVLNHLGLVNLDEIINEKIAQRKAHVAAIEGLDRELDILLSLCSPREKEAFLNQISSKDTANADKQNNHPIDANQIGEHAAIPTGSEKDILDLLTETDLAKFRENAYVNLMLTQVLERDYEPLLPSPFETEITTPFDQQLPNLFDPVIAIEPNDSHHPLLSITPTSNEESMPINTEPSISTESSSSSGKPTTTRGKRGPYKKRQKVDFVCENCQTTESPVWRCRKYGRIMCNACCLWMKRNNAEGKGWTCEKTVNK